MSKGCCGVQSFSPLLTLMMLLHPGSCLLHPCLQLATGCSKTNELMAMMALPFLHPVLITQPEVEAEAGLAASCFGNISSQRFSNNPVAEPFIKILRFLSHQKLNMTLLKKLIEITDVE